MWPSIKCLFWAHLRWKVASMCLFASPCLSALNRFLWNLILGNFTKSCWHIPIFVKIGQHNGHCTWRCTCISTHILSNSCLTHGKMKHISYTVYFELWIYLHFFLNTSGVFGMMLLVWMTEILPLYLCGVLELAMYIYYTVIILSAKYPGICIQYYVLLQC
jgi:hypothetical protein